MKRVFKIGEKVWYEDDHECGWGKIVCINGTSKYKEDICSDDNGDIITIRKQDGCGEIETTPSCIWQVAPNKFFFGDTVVWEHCEDIDYPFYCPDRQENCYHFEID